MLTCCPSAHETSQAEKRAIGDYYYMGELARDWHAHRPDSLPYSGRDERAREARDRRLLFHG